jgi:H+/Cl- antiporter ClcA
MSQFISEENKIKNVINFLFQIPFYLLDKSESVIELLGYIFIGFIVTAASVFVFVAVREIIRACRAHLSFVELVIFCICGIAIGLILRWFDWTHITRV